MTIIGNEKTLFSLHGTLDTSKCVDTFRCMTNLDKLDIDELNKTSESGMIYIQYNGKIFDDCSNSSEKLAKYKIVPTGFKLRFTDYPLFASFIKMNSMWQGAFIGTGVQLFEMYKRYYNQKEDFCNDYLDIFGGENRVRDIRGFGLAELLNNDDTLVYEDTLDDSEKSVSSTMSEALEKMQKKIKTESTNNSKSRHLSKSQRKALRLQSHLAKVKEKEDRQKEAKENADNQREIGLKDNIDWETVQNIEDVHESFVDTETDTFNKKIEDFINGDDKYKEFDTTNKDLPDTLKEEIEEKTEEGLAAEIEDSIITEEYTTKSNESVEEDNTPVSVNSLIKQMNSDNISMDPDKVKMALKMDVINDVYERLLIKENWRIDSKNRLGFYLKGIFLFIWQYRNANTQNDKNGYIMSDNNDKMLVNTGLIDTYGNYIYMIDHTPNIPGFYDKVVTVMNNKSSLLSLGFNILEVRNLPNPVKFVNNTNELLFDASVDQFDFDDSLHYYHIIKERLYRFPEKFRDTDPSILCERIKSAIGQAIKMSKSDYRYILPKYDFSRKTIQFLIPFYFDNTSNLAPELTIVVGKNENGLWTMYTVLDTDSAYDDARLICRPYDSWINIGRNKTKGDNYEN